MKIVGIILTIVGAIAIIVALIKKLSIIIPITVTALGIVIFVIAISKNKE